MKYERGRLDEFPKAFKEFRDWQAEQDILSDGVYGNESHNTMWDFLGMLKAKLQEADAKIMELTVRLQECCLPDDPGPVHPPENDSIVGMIILIGIGALIGYFLGVLL